MDSVFKFNEVIDDVKEKVVIRAAAFIRLVKSIYGLNQNVFEDVSTDPLIDDDKNKELNSILQNMTQHGAVSRYPSENADLIALLILKVVRFYTNDAIIHSKINMCVRIQLMGSHALNVNDYMMDRNKRAMEIFTLNNKFYEISQKIIGASVCPTVEFITVDGHGFHPDSQYLEFSI